ncbi:glycoside hydrolase family 28 protein [Bacteroides sp. 224]|uniref:glycoside hydrolase family 28 protein n=1 Tax=Bacteroides sp. 224 TaxID=2302936 RepID=UPI0013D1BBC2|nr:glycoside hydrolase family 28 protein [Bacteroides sp. 224]NDV66908.1 glycoside hydrolase family 28 protein [Bacteroides sp. 224]
MKNTFLALLSIIVILHACTQTQTIVPQSSPTGWDKVPEILKNIKEPAFSDTVFNILDYGAKSDTTFNSRTAILKAINACNLAGGGKVIIPSGNYFIKGPIVLKSHVNLYIEEGARLEFSTNPQDYLPMVLTKWEGTECYNYSPFIYSYQCTNVAITGKGVIDGNGAAIFNTWKKLEKPGMDRLRQMGNDSIPVYQRVFGEGYYLRPCMIQFFGCKNVLVDGVQIYDSPFWIIHPVYCNNVIVRNIYIDGQNYNNDGCDPESSTNVLIENVHFNVGDDGIAIKSGRDQDGWRVGQATENVIIRNCHFSQWAITIGSEMSGGVRNIYIEDCQIDSCRNGIYFKSNMDRGGFFENLYMRRIKADICLWGMVNFRTDYHGYRGGKYPTLFRNITIEDITCNRVDSVALMANGIPEAKLHNITLRNIDIKKAPKATQMKNVENLILDNIKVNGKLILEAEE